VMVLGVALVVVVPAAILAFLLAQEAARLYHAIDQATADLIAEQAAGTDPLRAGHDVDWAAQLAHGERIGLGTTRYTLVEIS